MTNRKPERPNWADMTTAIGAVIAALAAIYIPFAIEDAARTTRTAQAVNEVSRIVDGLVNQKDAMDRTNKKAGSDRYSYEYISRSTEVEGLVFRILNEYEYLCAGTRLGIFRADVIVSMRGDALIQTWDDYDKFLAVHRNSHEQNKNAWNECPPIIKRAAQELQ